MSSLPYPPSRQAVSVRKSGNLWILAGVTYGAVIIVTILSIAAYYYLASRHPDAKPGNETRSVAVGSAWVPVYPGAVVESTASARREGATENRLDFTSKDPADRVLSFYEKALKKGIFRFDRATRNVEGGTVRSILHEGRTTVVVAIEAVNQGSRGEITTVDREKRP